MASRTKGKVTSKKEINKAITDYANDKSVTIILELSLESDLHKIGSAYSFNDKDKTLTILIKNYLEQFPDEEEFILSLIRNIFEEGGLIFKQSKNELIDRYSSYYIKEDNKEILDFFSDKIVDNDFEALKMSLFIKHESDSGRNVTKMRKDLRNRFGDRGANISNLCTAGYFNNFFIPIYKKSKIDFEEVYDLAVSKKAYAIFIHSTMTNDALRGLFEDQINKSIRYHIEKFRMHALGSSNVDFLKDFLADNFVKENSKISITVDTDRNKPNPIFECSISINL